MSNSDLATQRLSNATDVIYQLNAAHETFSRLFSPKEKDEGVYPFEFDTAIITAQRVVLEQIGRWYVQAAHRAKDSPQPLTEQAGMSFANILAGDKGP